MLRKASSSISNALTAIFNLSLAQQKVPIAWKFSKINPIPKAKDISNCSNYRPISLLSLPSKILERIIHHHVSKFLSNHKLLSNIQFGFHSISSTQVTDTWQNMLVNHSKIAAVFLDVKKAFDSMPHSHLIKALHSIGIQGSIGLEIISPRDLNVSF